MITHDAGIANHAKRVMHIIDGVIGEGKYVLDENGEPVILEADGSKEVAHV
jgi:ABC-type lipoprotein export system ATPase subunit